MQQNFFLRTQRSQMLGHLRNVSGWKMITVKSTLLILNANFFRSLSFYLSLSLSLSLSLNVSLSLSLSLSQSHLLSPFVQLSFSLSVSYSFCSVSSRFSLSLSHAQYLLSTHSKNLTLPSYFQMFLSLFANTSSRTFYSLRYPSRSLTRAAHKYFNNLAITVSNARSPITLSCFSNRNSPD